MIEDASSDEIRRAMLNAVVRHQSDYGGWSITTIQGIDGEQQYCQFYLAAMAKEGLLISSDFFKLSKTTIQMDRDVVALSYYTKTDDGFQEHIIHLIRNGLDEWITRERSYIRGVDNTKTITRDDIKGRPPSVRVFDGIGIFITRVFMELYKDRL